MTGEDVKVARDFLGLTRAQLAEFLGVAESAPAQWERGERAPSGLEETVLEALRRAAASHPGLGEALIHLSRRSGRGEALAALFRRAYPARAR